MTKVAVAFASSERRGLLADMASIVQLPANAAMREPTTGRAMRPGRKAFAAAPWDGREASRKGRRSLLGRVQQQIAARGDYSFAGGRKPESKESLRSPHEDLRSLAHMP
jgi:hypothetical protein